MSETIYSPELVEKILLGVAEGKSLRAICEENSLAASTVRKWIIANENNLGEHYARARELQFDVWADDIIELADKCRVGTKTVVEEGKDGVKTIETTADMVDRTRLQIDARKWLLSKLHHKRYGDKLTAEVSGVDGGAIVMKWES